MDAKSKEQKERSRHRLQLDFSSEAYARLLEIRTKADASSNAEIVRNALRLYEWFLEQRESNSKIHVITGDVVKEVEMVF
ncbi:hypothetical protein LCGC14_0827970 [marine sediment metagenome]|uniref:Ribbon-helix-helix protein CopG domain-containing protein n=1 Tax=marine sediment metagenome TaxID=412755 RepID=A0A0F9Q216_9ZZZZ